jgi:hypothetical protein
VAWSSCYDTISTPLDTSNPFYQTTKQILFGVDLLDDEEVERAASPLTDIEDLEEGK